MKRTLVLHQINAMDVAPPAFVRVAAEAGCDNISVFTNCPNLVLPGQTARLDFPTITAQMKREMLNALAGNGVEVLGVEYLGLGVEFTPMTGGCRSLEQAVWFVDQVGRSDFAIGLDCLHFVRSGATAEALSKIDFAVFQQHTDL